MAVTPTYSPVPYQAWTQANGGYTQSNQIYNYSGLLMQKNFALTPFLDSLGPNTFTTSEDFYCTGFFDTGKILAANIPRLTPDQLVTNPMGSAPILRNAVTNTTMLFYDKVSVSDLVYGNAGRMDGINTANQQNNIGSEVDFQIFMGLQQIKRDVENSFINGTYIKRIDNATSNQTQGIVGAITSNVVDAGGGALTSTMGERIVVSFGDYNIDYNTEYTIMCSVANQIKLTNIYQSLPSVYNTTPLESTTGGKTINRIVIGPMVFRILINNNMPANVLLFINPSRMSMVEQPLENGNFYVERLAKHGMGSNYQIFGQCGLNYGLESQSGKIVNFI